MADMSAMLRAVLFDFDGLVVDTESIGYQTWNEIFQAHGHSLAVERYAHVVGTNFATAYDPRRDLEARTGKSFDWPPIEAQRRLREKELHRGMNTPLPGVLPVLEQARSLGIRRAIASSSQREWIDSWMRQLALGPHFEHFSTFDDTGRVKPDPSLFLHAAQALDVAPDEVLVLEDSLNGLRAASAAGMRCIVVPGPMTRHLDFAGAWRQLPSLEAVCLQEISARW
jgi:putative hydrolase of the HAD superfamily